jgi:hypothetical protein
MSFGESIFCRGYQNNLGIDIFHSLDLTVLTKWAKNIAYSHSCSSYDLITHNFNFILFTMPKVREERIKLLVMLVFFHQQSPCTWSLPCLYEQDILWTKHGWVCQLSQILQSEGPRSIRTCTLSKMLSTSTINASFQTAAGRTKNMGNTIPRGAVIKVSTSETRWFT